MKIRLPRTPARIVAAILVMLALPDHLHADSWAAPSDRTYRPTSGVFEFFVEASDRSRQEFRKGSRGTLRRKQGDTWESDQRVGQWSDVVSIPVAG